ncbi:MAG: hypothetical protein ABII74_05675 [Elusimicrobiota bacterium]
MKSEKLYEKPIIEKMKKMDFPLRIIQSQTGQAICRQCSSCHSCC